MLNSNYIIINRIPRKYKTMKIAGKTAIFLDESGKIVDNGAVQISDNIYAALFCDEVRNITLVSKKNNVHDVITLLWHDDEYLKYKELLKKAISVRFSEQNTRINRYAEAIAEKLDNGVELRVTDVIRDDEMVECPECGMLNPAGSKYCLDCGAEISL